MYDYNSNKLAEAGTHQNVKKHAGENPASSVKQTRRTRRRDARKTRRRYSIACAAGHYSKENLA